MSTKALAGLHKVLGNNDESPEDADAIARLNRMARFYPELLPQKKFQSKRRPSTKPFREKALRHPSRCYWCNKQMSKETATTDHLHPRSRGGSDDDSNYVLSCAKCNQWRGSKLVSQIQLPYARCLRKVRFEAMRQRLPLTPASIRLLLRPDIPIGDGLIIEFLRRSNEKGTASR